MGTITPVFDAGVKQELEEILKNYEADNCTAWDLYEDGHYERREPDVDEEKVFKKIKYEHPLYSEKTIEGQKLIRSIQGKNRTYFTGAHLGYGFHEDGIKSSVEVIKIING